MDDWPPLVLKFRAVMSYAKRYYELFGSTANPLIGQIINSSGIDTTANVRADSLLTGTPFESFRLPRKGANLGSAGATNIIITVT